MDYGPDCANVVPGSFSRDESATVTSLGEFDKPTPACPPSPSKLTPLVGNAAMRYDEHGPARLT
jgi:hypothetical protein